MVPVEITAQQGTSKTITTLGSVFLFVNNTIGPGLVLFPALYQQCGWFLSILSTTLLCFMSYFIGVMLTIAIRKIPHNKNDDLRIEYVDLIKYYLGFNDHSANHDTSSSLPVCIGTIIMRLSQFMYILFMLSFLMGSIIQSTQTFDLFIAKVFGKSFGLVYYPFNEIGFIFGDSLDTISPFNISYTYVLSIGTIIIYIALIPFCLKQLSEAIWIQYLGAYGTIILVLLWCIMLTFSAEFSTDNVGIITGSIYSLLPINFVNIAFISTYPSWLNEKRMSVSHKRVLKWTCFGTLLCCVLVGYIGGIAFYPYYTQSADMISKLNNFKPNDNLRNINVITFFKWFGPISGYIYPLLQSASGIPPFCSIIRYNLLNTDILHSKCSANVVSIVIPFTLSILLYHGNGFNNLLNWTGVVFSSFINFILPIFFYYKSCKRPRYIWYLISKSKHHLDQLSKSNIDLLSSHYEECNILNYDNNKQCTETETIINPKNTKDLNKAFYFLSFTILLSVIAFIMDLFNMV